MEHQPMRDGSREHFEKDELSKEAQKLYVEDLGQQGYETSKEVLDLDVLNTLLDEAIQRGVITPETKVSEIRKAVRARIEKIKNKDSQ